MINSVKLIAPSILSSDFSKLGEEVKAVEQAGADWIHIDVMDGHFVPNITVGPQIVKAVRTITKLPLDVHLMIENPERYLKNFVSAGADSITIHKEVVSDVPKMLAQIRELGAKAGVSINPATPVESIFDILSHADLVLIMTVNPGFGGQSFIESCVEKVEKISKLKKEKNLLFLIETDGGISEETASKVSKAGCDVFVAGSAIFNSKNKDYKAAIQKIRTKL